MASSDAEQSTQPRQRITTIVLAALAIFFLILRLLARRVKQIDLGADDWTLIAGLVGVLVVAGVNLACVQYGMGKHTDTIPENRAIMYYKLLYVFEPLYITTAGIIKISVLLMYRRIFPVRYIKVGCYILGAITIAWVISIDLLAIFQCTPISKAFNRALPGHCIDLKGALIGNGAPNFVTDIFILALPVRLIWRLQASLWQRLSVICVFLTGSFVVFASIYRFSLIFQFEITDIAWTLADAQTWCVVEIAAGIISACLPTTTPLVRICTSGLVSKVRTLSRSNLTRGEDETARTITVKDDVIIETDNAHRAMNASYALSEMSPGTRGSLHLKGKGWTMITADHDKDSA
ncbi:hypothetical protein N7462_008931 [Penicillium macrosclerotiorum]|uniref:uncharacterized protein n=1 Tax=Penicillium macrosclerotiorum TaxID=303699 RepID=UPI0025476307|nr:uncharacterized protein N7462_008931 [Penicillium macrosclerotiorum]KAJ5676034.1 hypothetical protein N7462_008931 [Penicillium macrosclerotiorum]